MTKERNQDARSNRALESTLPEPAPLDARALLAVLWRRRWLIAPVMAAVLGIFAWWSLTKQPEYRALARVQVVAEEPAVPGLAAEAVGARIPSDPVASEIQVLRSRSLLYAVADSLILQLSLGPGPWRRDELFPGLALDGPVEPGKYALAFTPARVEVRDEEDGHTLASGAPGETVAVAGLRFALPGRPGGEVTEVRFVVRDRREAGEALYEAFSANIVERTNLVDLSLRHHDPALAAQALNAIIQLGRRQSVERQRQRASTRRGFIERQLASFETQLQEAQADVQGYQESIGAVSLESEQSGQIENILAFERQVEELRLERQLYRPILEGLNREGAEQAASFEALAATPALVKNPAIADLYRRLVGLEVKRDSLLSGPVGAGRQNPAVQAVDDQIATAAGKLTEALREYIAGIDRQIAELRGTIARLQRESEGRLPQAAELARRQQRVESLRKVYEALQTQLEQTRIEEASESGRLAIIDPAVAPREPVNATGIPDIILALMLAGMLGFGAALAVDYFDDRLRTPDEVRRDMGLTVLGAVPRFDGKNGGRPGHPAVLADAQSPVAEAYRVIRTNLSFSLAVKPRATLLVTSPSPGEGKTTTAVNGAIVAAQQGQRVVLVDADLRRAQVHEVFGLSQRPGLTDVLAGGARLDEVLVSTDVEGLDCVPSGALPPNPAELLGAERMEALLAELAARYDRVIVDSPPVLAVADASILVQRLGAALMVVRAGGTDRRALVDAIERLSAVGGDVLGVVVNALKPGGRGYYYYASDYYGNGRKRGLRERLGLGSGR